MNVEIFRDSCLQATGIGAGIIIILMIPSSNLCQQEVTSFNYLNNQTNLLFFGNRDKYGIH